MNRILLFCLLTAVILISCPLPPNGEDRSLIDSLIYSDPYEKSTDWTVLYYVDGDNNLEEALIDDIEELADGLESAELINVVVLLDRISSYSDTASILGSNFTDTRLFRIGPGDAAPLQGGTYFEDIGMAESGEYNMGDGETLKKFIEYGKEYYPADHYALIFSNHGGGVRAGSSTDPDDVKAGSGLAGDLSAAIDKAVCYDETSNSDCLYTAELTDVLDSRHSVDLIVYDACLMGLLEIGYQYRPGVSGEFSADYMVASAPNVWWYGFPYDYIFSRISKSLGGTVTGRTSDVTGSSADTYYYDPSTMTAEQFGLMFVEEQDRDTSSGNDQSLALYDLSKAANVTAALNTVAVDLTATNLDNIRDNSDRITYFDESDVDEWYAWPTFDLSAFALSSSNPSGNAAALDTAVDAMVLASFGDSSEFSGFTNGTSGLGFFFPDGGTTIPGYSNTYWYYQWWYTGEDLGSDYEFGKLTFCTSDDDGVVDGWFELLQSLYNPYDPQGTSADQSNYDYYHPGRW